MDGHRFDEVARSLTCRQASRRALMLTLAASSVARPGELVSTARFHELHDQAVARGVVRTASAALDQVLTLLAKRRAVRTAITAWATRARQSRIYDETREADYLDALAQILPDDFLETRQVADLAGWPYSFTAAWITLRVTSDLSAVGLTAAVAGALARDYGLLGGRRNIFHQNIHDVIMELAVMVKPTLVILDGVTTMMTDRGIDTGDILLQKELALPYPFQKAYLVGAWAKLTAFPNDPLVIALQFDETELSLGQYRERVINNAIENALISAWGDKIKNIERNDWEKRIKFTIDDVAERAYPRKTLGLLACWAFKI